MHYPGNSLRSIIKYIWALADFKSQYDSGSACSSLKLLLFTSKMGLGNTRFLVICCAFLFVIHSGFSTPAISEYATVNELAAVKFLQALDKDYSEACRAQTTARWNYITNVTDYTERVSVSINTV